MQKGNDYKKKKTTTGTRNAQMLNDLGGINFNCKIHLFYECETHTSNH